MEEEEEEEDQYEDGDDGVDVVAAAMEGNDAPAPTTVRTLESIHHRISAGRLLRIILSKENLGF